MSSSAKDAVLAKIRASLGRPADDATRRAAVAERLSTSPRGTIPARGQLPQAEKVALFCTMAEKVQATIARVANPAEVPAAVADYLRARNLPPRLRMGADPRLAAMPWSAQTHLEIEHGRAEGSDEVTCSHATAGVAESGTLVLTSGNDNPTTLNFLPEHHVVVLSAADIEGDFESVWARIRASYGKGVMPRTVNMVTGPSRSADIEQTLLLGAHGPRALHIVVVGD